MKLVTRLLIFLALVSLNSLCWASSQKAGNVGVSIPAFLGKGVNVLGYDGIWSNPKNTRFSRERFRMIHEAGFTHVRVNLFAFKFQDGSGGMSDSWLKVLDSVVDMATSEKLFVVLDVHDFQFCQKNAEDCISRLVPFWKTIAGRYSGRSMMLAYDILNEPGGSINPDVWNSALSVLVPAIRELDSSVYILLSAAGGGSFKQLAKLKLPEDHFHVIAQFHYYEPMRFTHQGAKWILPLRFLGGVEWGSDADLEKMKADFSVVREWSEKNKIPMYLGEFGVYEPAPSESKSRYLRSVVSLAKDYGWGWSYWQFDHDFALYDDSRGGWDFNILNSLLLKN